MPPGSDIVQGGGLTAAQRLSGSSITPPRPISVELPTNDGSKPPEQSNLSARERLRAHVHRNLQIQQEAAQKASEKALSSGEVSGAPAAIAASSAMALQLGVKQQDLQSLYAPIQDTRLGVSDINGEEPGPPEGASPEVPEALREARIDMSLDAGGLAGSGGAQEGEEESVFAESEPFIPSSEWSGLEGVDHLYYSSGSGGGAKDVVGVDDEWVQGIYDMEGMAPDE